MLTSVLKFSEFLLNETLKTHDIDLTIKNFSSKFNSSNLTINKNPNSATQSVSRDANTFDLLIKDVNISKSFPTQLEQINLFLLNRHGWYPSKMDIINLYGSDNKMGYDLSYILHINENGIPRFSYFKDIRITYEAKYDTQINIPPDLYHLSIEQYKKDILNRGLIPKSKNKKSNHLDRIYVCDNPDNCYKLINDMKFSYYNKYEPNILKKMNLKWIIYHIDGSNLKDIKLFKDPNYNSGFYIVENIPKELIKIHDQEM